MLNWLKDKWEFVAAGITVVAVFLLGRKGKNAADRKTELKENKVKKEESEKIKRN